RKLVDIDAVKEGGGIGPLNVDLTKGRHITHADRAADSLRLPRDAGVDILVAIFAKILRAKPKPSLDEHGAVLGSPIVRRWQPLGAELLAAMMARERTTGDL